MTKFGFILGVIGMVSLTACGGGGGPDGENLSDNRVADTQTFKLRENEYWKFRNSHSNVAGLFDRGYTRIAPSSGRAEYTGVSAFYADEATENNPQLFGRSHLVADFGTDRVSGKIDQFVARSGHTTTGGEINYDGVMGIGTIPGSTYAGASGRLTGSVNLDGKQHGLDDPFGLIFLGSDAEGYFVNVKEDATTSAGSKYGVFVTGTQD